MKYTQICMCGVILGLCLNLSVSASQPALKKAAPPPGFEQDATLLTDSQIDPLEALDVANLPDPRPFTPPRHYLCLESVGGIAIDGHFSDSDWKKTIWSETFIDIRAPYGSAQPVPMTKFKMLRDSEYLYIAAILSDYNIRAKNVFRDNPEAVDFDLEIYIDANADNHQYLVLKINATNSLQSFVYSRPPKDGGTAIPFPIQGIQHAVFVEGTINQPGDRDKAWQVEIAIPLAAPAILGGVSKDPANGETWRVNFARVEWRGPLVLSTEIGNYKPEQLASMQKLIRGCWSPQGVINMHRPETWGYLQFYRLPPGRNAWFQPDPTEWARHMLHKVLYAQKWHYTNVGAYADSLDLLGLDKTPPMFATEPITITAGPDTFTAGVQLRLPEMTIKTIAIDQQAKITVTSD